MGRKITVYLTDEELTKLEDLCKANGQNNNSRIIKLAISKLHADAGALKEHKAGILKEHSLTKGYHGKVIEIEGLKT